MPEPRRLNEFEFHHVLEASRGLALVMFSGPACGACRQLRRVLADAAFAELQLFEVDAATDMGLTSEFEVFHLPALFLFQDGRFHSEIQAEARVPQIHRAIEAALAGPAREAP